MIWSSLKPLKTLPLASVDLAETLRAGGAQLLCVVILTSKAETREPACVGEGRCYLNRERISFLFAF